MLQQLAHATSAQGWVIAAMLVFVVVFAGVVVQVLRRDRALDEHCARLPLDDAPARSRSVPPTAADKVQRGEEG